MENPTAKEESQKNNKPSLAVRSISYQRTVYSSDTESFARPLALLEANTRRPFAVAILERNPCLFLRFLFEGWNVLFIFFYQLCFYIFRIEMQR
ncbi:hypothetical protein HQ45_03440 [Porphyromonas crevioricanis]|nr:hypothetical protein HQ45_03440 [Porphyromonas crevioricanis]